MSQRVPPGSPEAAIIADEEKLLARVQARVALGPEGEAGPRASAGDFDRELVELRDAIAEAKPEDLAPLVEQMTRLAALKGQTAAGSQSLPVDVDSPYFAHMVLSEAGRSREVLIGKRGFIDRGAGVQIVDWRNAPISQVYYRYDEGDDYEEEIAGRRLEGLVEVRRNVSITRSRLRRIGSPQGTFVCDARNVWHQASGEAAPVLQGGQGKAARAPKPPERRRGRGRRDREHRLGVQSGPVHRADKHLPEIAALIDREQFELITQPESGLVVIQGGAGSGKTTVALHRIAFLRFADPKRFKPQRILFVVPTRSLARYVAAVLPSLGVSGVPVATYDSWARSTRLRLLRGTSGKVSPETPDQVSRVKKHPALLDLLEQLCADEVRRIEAVLSELGDEVLAAWRDRAGEATVPRLRALRRWVKRQSSLPAGVRVRGESEVGRLIERADDVIADWAELLTDRARLAPLAAAGGVAERDLDQTVEWVVAQQEAPAQPRGPDGALIESVDGRDFEEEHPAGRFDPEDDPILLRLIQLKRGALVSSDSREIEYAHVAIDEAQDRSAIEVKVLLEAVAPDGGDPARRSATIAGDTAQRLVFDNSFIGWDELLARVGQDAAVVRPLKLSYRSTAEVMDLARQVLGPELCPPEPLVARSGAPVELYEFGGIGEAVALLSDALRALAAREPTASVALLARHPEQADIYYEGLARAEVPSLRRVRRHDFSFTPGIDVTDVGQVKGLEFDYVIMVEVSAATYPDTLESRHLLHIGMTRAAHQLWLVTTTEPSPLLPASLLGE